MERLFSEFSKISFGLELLDFRLDPDISHHVPRAGRLRRAQFIAIEPVERRAQLVRQAPRRLLLLGAERGMAQDGSRRQAGATVP
jgi:hypothetical protein